MPKRMTKVPPELQNRIEAIEAELTRGDHQDWVLTFRTPKGIVDRVILCDNIEEIQMCVQSAEGVLARLGYETEYNGHIELNEITYYARLEVSELVIYEDKFINECARVAQERQVEGVRMNIHNERVLLLRVTRRKHVTLTVGNLFKVAKIEWCGVVGRTGNVQYLDSPILMNPETDWRIPVGGPR
jgi:hypothetical protein